MKSSPLHLKLQSDRWYRACPAELQAALVRLSLRLDSEMANTFSGCHRA